MGCGLLQTTKRFIPGWLQHREVNENFSSDFGHLFRKKLFCDNDANIENSHGMFDHIANLPNVCNN